MIGREIIHPMRRNGGSEAPISRIERQTCRLQRLETRPMATVAADRHLLFGLLALQNGIINQA